MTKLRALSFSLGGSMKTLLKQAVSSRCMLSSEITCSELRGGAQRG